MPVFVEGVPHSGVCLILFIVLLPRRHSMFIWEGESLRIIVHFIIYSRGEHPSAHRSTGRGWIVRGHRVSSACLFVFTGLCLDYCISFIRGGDANICLLRSDSLPRCCRFDDGSPRHYSAVSFSIIFSAPLCSRSRLFSTIA